MPKPITPAPLILAIDTSCDDTSAAVTCGTEIWSNVIASQTQLHKEYGGVFPTVAKQAHRENLPGTVAIALRRAGVSWDAIAAIAVTQGPGLAPSLEVGISFVKELAELHQKPVIAVNHIEGHVLSPLAHPRPRANRSVTSIPTPQDVLALVVSGGHTEFVWVHTPGKYEILGSTVDDAAGECLDKVGRMLDLGYPAGPLIERFAKLGNPKAFSFPLPMTTTKDFNLSFSGMKTAARNKLEELARGGDLNKTQIYDFCASFQYAVFRAITYKLSKILQTRQPTEIWLGGGVAANMELRRMIRSQIKKSLLPSSPESNQDPTSSKITPFRAPYTKKLCMDNAAMIGVVANYMFVEKKFFTDLNTLERLPRLQLTHHS
jgi:N6-L-threonylcarbamoyladenine synthase